MTALNYGSYTVTLFSESINDRIVYAMMDGETARAVWPLLKEPRPVLAAVSGMDWNRELSPWSAPRAFRGGDDFGGEGGAFLDILTGRIIPLVEAHLGSAPAFRAIAGYSLAGLFALWSVFVTDTFNRAASISGSLWFDGFLEHINAHRPHNSVERLYLSLGDREKNSRNLRLAAVEDCTLLAAERLRDVGVPVTFALNRGGHFDDVPGRIARGINALM